MVQMAAGEFEDRFEELGLKVVFEEAVPGQKLMIQADGSQLWRVLDNLLSNIVKYAKENSQVASTTKNIIVGGTCANLQLEGGHPFINPQYRGKRTGPLHSRKPDAADGRKLPGDDRWPRIPCAAAVPPLLREQYVIVRIVKVW